MITKIGKRLLILGMLVGCLSFFNVTSSKAVNIYTCEDTCIDIYNACFEACGNDACRLRCGAKLERCLSQCNLN